MGTIHLSQLQERKYHKIGYHSGVNCMGIDTDKRGDCVMARIRPGAGITFAPTKRLRLDDMVGTFRLICDGLGMFSTSSEADQTK
jgi:hypothetical protein